jgi:hypothetical protein
LLGLRAEDGVPVGLDLRTRRLQRALAVCAALVLGCACTASDKPSAAEFAGGRRPNFSTVDPMTRACDLPVRYLKRISRGYDTERSEDLVLVPRAPNYMGSFVLTSHSGPWDYLQRIPLLLYGPGHVGSVGPVARRVKITDVYPTVGRLLDVDQETRSGRPLREALSIAASPPKLVMTIVWDGVGRNTLRAWRDRWPTFRRLQRRGASYVNATVGSSPSITGVTHSSLGTGAFPRQHGITGNQIRTSNGTLVQAFKGRAAKDLEVSTFADQVDVALGNEPRVGLLGWKQWHLGMLGHGADFPSGDVDDVDLLHFGPARMKSQDISGAYSSNPGLAASSDIHEHIERLDRKDGKQDGLWLGHDVTVGPGRVFWDTYSNPAWVEYQTDLVLTALERGSYGRDAVPDLFFTNFKMSDLAGHRWGVESPETGAVLRSLDLSLGRIVEYLDEEVGDYAVVVTSDHGHSRSARSTGAWPIVQDELIGDVDRHFGARNGITVVETAVAYGLFLDRSVMRSVGISVSEIARFLNNYTIAENWPKAQLPVGYTQRGGEQVFSAAFPGRLLPAALRCASSERGS